MRKSPVLQPLEGSCLRLYDFAHSRRKSVGCRQRSDSGINLGSKPWSHSAHRSSRNKGRLHCINYITNYFEMQDDSDICRCQLKQRCGRRWRQLSTPPTNVTAECYCPEPARKTDNVLYTI